MKSIYILPLFAAMALIVPPQAEAGREAKALIGGLVGGVLIGSALAGDDIHTSVSVGYGTRGGYHRNGHYSYVTVKKWIPGYYERRSGRYGRSHRVWITGHYAFVKQKVWVEARPVRHRRHYSYDRFDRHDRHDRFDRRNRFDRDGRRDSFDRRDGRKFDRRHKDRPDRRNHRGSSATVVRRR